VDRLSKWADAVVVVGGKNSANTTRLARVASENNPRVFHIETEDELVPADFDNLKKVAVVSGASTPSWLLNRVTEYLNQVGNAQRRLPARLAVKAAEFLIFFNVYLALGAALVTGTAAMLQGNPVNLLHMVIAGLYINSMYILNRLTNIRANQYEEVFKLDYLHRNPGISIFVCVVTGLAALGFSYKAGIGEFVLLLLACAAGIVYHVNILPPNDLPFLRHRKLKDIPLSKDVGISLAWSVICVFYPYTGRHFLEPLVNPETILTFFFVFLIVFIRTNFHDLYDIQRDRIVGRETLPIVLGKKFRKLFPYPLLVAAGLLPLAAALAGILPAASGLLAGMAVYLGIVYYLFNHDLLGHAMVFYTVVDFIFIIPFILLWLGQKIF
jgi:4-hydroxy-3-methylbut-2-enyl diphosphate reductase